MESKTGVAHTLDLAHRKQCSTLLSLPARTPTGVAPSQILRVNMLIATPPLEVALLYHLALHSKEEMIDVTLSSPVPVPLSPTVPTFATTEFKTLAQLLLHNPLATHTIAFQVPELAIKPLSVLNSKAEQTDVVFGIKHNAPVDACTRTSFAVPSPTLVSTTLVSLTLDAQVLAKPGFGTDVTPPELTSA